MLRLRGAGVRKTASCFLAWFQTPRPVVEAEHAGTGDRRDSSFGGGDCLGSRFMDEVLAGHEIRVAAEGEDASTAASHVCSIMVTMPEAVPAWLPISASFSWNFALRTTWRTLQALRISESNSTMLAVPTSTG